MSDTPEIEAELSLSKDLRYLRQPESSKKWRKVFTLPWATKTANKDHICTWCGKSIVKGVKYATWLSPRAADGSFGDVSKVHAECLPALLQGPYEYKPFKNRAAAIGEQHSQSTAGQGMEGGDHV